MSILKPSARMVEFATGCIRPISLRVGDVTHFRSDVRETAQSKQLSSAARLREAVRRQDKDITIGEPDIHR